MKSYFVLPALLIAFLNEGAVWAQTSNGAATPPPAPSFLMQLPVFAALFALFYFLMIRPHRQQAKKHAEFIANLSKGDEVVLMSGFFGKIVGLTDRVATVEISDGVEIKVLKSQIQSNAKTVLA